jgi:signal peptidase I
MSKLYNLRKSRNILQWVYKWYKKKGKDLPKNELENLENNLETLDAAILREDRILADEKAHQIESFGKNHIKKSVFEQGWELLVALIVALVVAVLVRQMWFEPYEIPTGSMRPTFAEQDRVTVSKTAFGINYPLETKHLYFDPDLIQRTSIFIFSAENLPHIDTKATYFGVLPYTKRLIKRCMGKPGDYLYFYGGKIYGIDKNGNEIQEFLNSPWLEKIEHIPFISFEGGRVFQSKGDTFIFKQINIPLGKVIISPFGDITGEIYTGKEWIKDQPAVQNKVHQQIESYSDFWGIRNFAMARLLTKEQAKRLTDIDLTKMEEGVLYLELRHNPDLTYPKPGFVKDEGRYAIVLNPYVTLLPLNTAHLKAIMNNMYTARFVVKNGKAIRYNIEVQQSWAQGVSFPNVPDGTYEFYYGKASKVDWGGITFELAKDHPLYNESPEHIQKLYNLGIEMNIGYAPSERNQVAFPNRYSYFRDGDLYLLGAPIIKKGEPVLTVFHANEEKRASLGTTNRPYIPFKDYGAPIKNGKLDKNFIKTFGLKVPEKSYMALGDNHAMSGDSRSFGFVPEDNIQGAPCLILWPPGDRWGFPAQKPYPLLTGPRLFVWGIALLIGIIWYIIHCMRLKKPVFKKIA